MFVVEIVIDADRLLPRVEHVDAAEDATIRVRHTVRQWVSVQKRDRAEVDVGTRNDVVYVRAIVGRPEDLALSCLDDRAVGGCYHHRSISSCGCNERSGGCTE